jgi:cytochrome P450
VVNVRRFVHALIVRRRAAPNRHGDLLDHLMAATDPETGQTMDDGILEDNLVTFLAAGHDTSAHGLTWALYLVASHARTERQLLAEIEAVAGNTPITAEHLPRLKFCAQVIKEALRLYPPSAGLARTAERDIVVGGHRIRKGQLVLIPTYAIHRSPAHWDNPDAFIAERFAEDRPQPARNIYLPFGIGPRICIGATFAMAEMTAILATLVRAVKIIPDPSRPPRIRVSFTLKPDGGLPVSVEPRS